MDKKKSELMLYRVMSGRTEVVINNTTYLIHSPTITQKRHAEIIYQEAYQSAIYDAWVTDDINKQLLISIDYISKEIDENFKEIEKRIDELKVELFESMFDSLKQEQIRTKLYKVKATYNKMYEHRHQYRSMTREGFADLLKMQYLIAMTTTDLYNNRIWLDENINDASFSLLDKLIRGFTQQRLDEKEVRYLARMDIWRGYWIIGKSHGNPFGKSAIELTDDQRLLCQITRMYDSAYEHPECPDDEVIKDDDAFDGWMIKERNKNKRDKTEKIVDNLTGGKHQNAHELFVVAKTDKDREKIESLNDARAKAIKKQREIAINQKGVLQEAQLPDQKLKIHTQLNQMGRDTIKKRGKG